MTAKERNEHLVNKWNFMLEPLDKKKSSKTRYAKIFENTALHSNTSTIKIALALLQRMLYAIPTVKASTSGKTTYFLGEFERDLVIDGSTIMPDGASAFIDYVTNLAVERYEEELEKLHHIMITTESNMIKVYVVY